MPTKFLLCLLLIGFSLPALAREVPATSGDDEAAVVQDDEAEADARGVDKRTGQPASKARPAARRAAETESAARPPRWHSFLPGMFR
ncbi:MAG: hypothetical protein NVV60_09345 [Luteimonas sp.]|nr:hypothetical protein [Luteimonas sp.]